jgi:hypothetical protein
MRSWLRTKITRWVLRFFCHRNATTSNENRPPHVTAPPPPPAMREVRLSGVRSDLLLVSVDGVGVMMMQRRPTTSSARRWEVRSMRGMPVTRFLSLCRHVRRVVPSDFGLDHLIVERDGIRMYFGPHDDIHAVLSDDV